jgi:hypothetical protein
MIASYLLLMLLPGAGLYMLVEKEPRLLELALAATILSPILLSIVAVLAMVSGLPVSSTAAVFVFLVFVLGIKVFVVRAPLFGRGEVTGRQGLVLFGIIAAFCALTGFLPLTSEWWRMRSDAWFHLSTIAQISDYGVPPEDPYFYGFPLQYMWFYHVLVLIVSRATGIGPGYVMAIVNIQALTGFMLATFLLSQLLTKRFAHSVSAMLTGILGINALFWLFIPIKLLPAFVGEDRGMHVIRNALALTPLNNITIRKFLIIYNNQYFFLNKFIVLTAFSVALSFMAACWFGMTAGIATKRPVYFVLAFLAAVGMIAFHPIVGFISLAGLGLGLLLFFVSRSQVTLPSRWTAFKFGLLLVAAVVVLLPYLYNVMHGKDSEQMFPINVGVKKIGGLIIACALGLFLAAYQVKKLVVWREPEARFFALAALSIIVVCLLIHLPGPNIIDKPAFFMFFPLAIAGGWTLAELPERRFALFKTKWGMALVFVVLFLPLNFIGFLGDYATPTPDVLTPEEAAIAEWARENTSREAIFVDNKDRNFILVAGPRRNYYGSHSYAKQWGYDKEEMTRRKRVIDNLFSGEELEPATLTALCEIGPDVYIVLRGRDESNTDANKFLQIGDIFIEAFSTGPATVLKVNKDACRNFSGD